MNYARLCGLLLSAALSFPAAGATVEKLKIPQNLHALPAQLEQNGKFDAGIKLQKYTESEWAAFRRAGDVNRQGRAFAFSMPGESDPRPLSELPEEERLIRALDVKPVSEAVCAVENAELLVYATPGGNGMLFAIRTDSAPDAVLELEAELTGEDRKNAPRLHWIIRPFQGSIRPASDSEKVPDKTQFVTQGKNGKQYTVLLWYWADMQRKKIPPEQPLKWEIRVNHFAGGAGAGIKKPLEVEMPAFTLKQLNRSNNVKVESAIQQHYAKDKNNNVIGEIFFQYINNVFAGKNFWVERFGLPVRLAYTHPFASSRYFAEQKGLPENYKDDMFQYVQNVRDLSANPYLLNYFIQHSADRLLQPQKWQQRLLLGAIRNRVFSEKFTED